LRHNPDCTNSDELGCSNVEDFDVENIIVHDEFDYESARYGSKFEHDIALIRLSKDIAFDSKAMKLSFVKVLKTLN